MKQILLAGAALLVLSACATKPKMEEQAPPVEQTETAPPIFEEVAPPAPLTETLPPVETGPAYDLPVPGSEADFAYQSGGEPRVFFGYDQYGLSEEARDVLRRQANWLSIYEDASATIEGHADERGTREYNLALGARRADSVKAFLVSQGIAPSRLRTISYGKERPIDASSSESGWSRNRNGFTKLRLGGVS